MSLLPIIFNDDWCSMRRPTRNFNEHFGMGLDFNDMLSPFHAALVRCPAGYYRPWLPATAKSDTGSTIVADKDKFQVNLDVQQFNPEEITVKVTGKNIITVEGKHEEKQDEHGFISRHFIRRYVIPDNHDSNNIVSSLSSDGVLSITAPRIAITGEEQRTIPIQQTGVPLKAEENKKQEDKTNEKKD